MKTLDEIRDAFGRLPKKITTDQIAEATGRKPSSVQRNWLQDPTFPRGEDRHDRDAVLKWISEQSFTRADRPGPRDLAPRAAAIPPLALRLSTPEIAGILGVHRSAIGYHATANPPETSANPFPQPDDDGLLDWPQVRAWFLRKSPGHADTGAEATGIDIDQAAAAQGREPTTAWLAEQLGISQEAAHRIQLANSTTRLRPLALSRALGISYDSVKHYVQTRTPQTCDDPFPAADDHNTRDVEEVRAWLGRNTTPAPPADTTRLRPAALARHLGIGRGNIAYYAKKYTPDTADDPFPAADEHNTRDPEEVRAWLARHSR